MSNAIIIRSAADAAAFNLTWRFIEDGEGYGIFTREGEPLQRHYDDEGEPDGWELVVEEQVKDC